MTAYTSVFGGLTILPSQDNYTALTLNISVTLVWPLEAPGGSNVASQIIDVNAQAPGLTITMPPADQASPGQSVVFNGVGPNLFFVLDAIGNTLLTVNPGEAWTLYLTSNSTTAGSWRSFQAGASVSQAQASALAGAGLVALGSTLAQSATVLETSVPPTNITAASRAAVLRWTGGAGTFTFDPANSMGTDWLMEVRNDGSGNLVLDPNAGELINSVATITLAPGDSCEVHCDGTAFYTIGLGKSAVIAFDLDAISVAGSGDFSLLGPDQNRIGYKFTGVLTGNRNILVPNTVQQYWVDNSTTGAFTLTVKTVAGTGVVVDQGTRAILYCDGINVIDADTQGISTPVQINQGGTGAITAAGARANLGSTAVGDAVFTAATATAARATLGSGIVGDPVFTAATQAVALGALGAAGLALANVFTTQQLIRIAANAGLVIENQTNSAIEEAGLDLYRDRGINVGVNGDIGMSLLWSFNSSTLAKRFLAKLVASAPTLTNGSEDGQLDLKLMRAGVADVGKLTVANGFQVRGAVGAAPTGGDQGVGTINAAGGYFLNAVPIRTPLNVSRADADYAVVIGDNYTVQRFSAISVDRTVSSSAAASLGAGFIVGIVNDSVTNNVIFDPNGAETINGLVTTITLPPGFGVWFQCTGSGWVTEGVIRGPGIPIGRVIASASANLSLSFASVPLFAREVVVNAEDLFPVSNTVDLWGRVSTDGGATYDSGASNYSYNGHAQNILGIAGQSSDADTKIVMNVNPITNAISDIQVNFMIRICGPRRTAKPSIQYTGNYRNTTPHKEWMDGEGNRLSNHSIDGFQLLFSSGNISTGAMEAWWN